MKEYLLFIDTEATGLPGNWSLPYDAPGNWPYCVQISWLVYSREGEKIKEEDHYIKDDDFTVADSAIKVHGITKDFLKVHGKPRQEVLNKLSDDIAYYHPLVVGHFMQFDFHLLAADFFRSGMHNPFVGETSFCTMLGTSHLVKNPSVKFLRLEQLYTMLFQKSPERMHNAIGDAGATAACFFELLERGEINSRVIEQQQRETAIKKPLPEKYGCLPLLTVFCFIVLIFYYL